jgi:tetratricopeptide (TPR) repeat protein
MEKNTSEIAKLTERISKDPKSKLFVPLAEEYKKTGDLETAIRVLGEGLKNNPTYITARSFLGRLLMEAGDLAGAQKELEEVVKVIPDNLLAQRKLGDLHVLRGNRAEALARYKAALQLNPGDKEVTSLIADIEAGRVLGGRSSQSSAPSASGATANAAAAASSATARTVRPVVVPATKPTAAAPAPASSAAGQPTLTRPKTVTPAVPEKKSSAEHPVSAPAAPHSSAAEITSLKQPSFPGAAPPSATVDKDPLSPAVSAHEPVSDQSTFEVPDLAEPEKEVEIVEDIVELEPLEQLAADAAASSGDQAEADGELAFLEERGEEFFDLSEPAGCATPLVTPAPVEWVPPVEAGSLSASPSPVPEDSQDDINTDTLAELYISQAFYEKAIEIYERMLNERPGTAALERKLESLRALAAASADKTGTVATPIESTSSGDSLSTETPPPLIGEPAAPTERPAMEAAEVSLPTAELTSDMPGTGADGELESQAMPSEPPEPRKWPRTTRKDETVVVQEEFKGTETGNLAPANETFSDASGTPLSPDVRRKETIDRLENWLKNVIKEKPL